MFSEMVKIDGNKMKNIFLHLMENGVWKKKMKYDYLSKTRECNSP